VSLVIVSHRGCGCNCHAPQVEELVHDSSVLSSSMALRMALLEL
jgi:hypothetical protein